MKVSSHQIHGKFRVKFSQHWCISEIWEWCSWTRNEASCRKIWLSEENILTSFVHASWCLSTWTLTKICSYLLSEWCYWCSVGLIRFSLSQCIQIYQNQHDPKLFRSWTFLMKIKQTRFEIRSKIFTSWWCFTSCS